MSSNPYSSPQAESQSAPSPQGVFRDGQLLVVPAEGAMLPLICFKSLVETTGEFSLSGRFLPKSSRSLTAVLGGAVGYAIMQRIQGQRVSLTLPLSKEWAGENRRKLRWGWAVFGSSFAWIFAGAALAYFHAAFILLGVILTVLTMFLGRAKNAVAIPYFSVTDTRDG